MASVNLTSGAISKISQGLGDKLQPVLQVVEIRLVNTQQSSAERYRMLLSDGVHHQQGMLATQMNGIVKSGQLQKGSIVQLNEFICNTIQNRRIIIIISLQVLVEKTDMIGEPKNYDVGNPISQSRAAGPGQQQQQSDVGSRVNGHDAGQHVVDGNSPYTAPLSGGPLPATRNIHNASSPRPAASGSFLDQKRFSGSSNSGVYQPPSSSYNSSYPQPPPMYTANRGPIARNEAPARIIPIAALNPYQGKWTIKARVTAKSDVRHYNNARGEGKVFSFDLLDADGGEIRATCFNAVADQFYDQIEVGRVYLISKGALRPTQRSFNHLNSEYEIMLESTSTIQPCFEGDSIIPKQRFNFRSVSEIESMENNAMADVIGIVTSINPAGTIMRKNGTETHKRTLQLKDMSGKSVEVTLWGIFCNAEGQKIQAMCDSGVFPALAIKAGRVSDFSGRSIGTITSSQLLVDPDIPEAHHLKDWYENEGKNHAAASISREVGAAAGRMDARKTVSQIKDEGLGRSEKPDWITVKATVSFIKVDSFCYTACPLMVGDRQCNKKVNNNGDGTWHCDRCDQSFPECDYRYLLQFQMQDHTGVTWATAFQECGEEILGVTAKELYLLKYEEQDEAKFAEIVRRVLFSQFLFKLKVKEETFSDEQRVKSTAVKAERVNSASECRFLLNAIERLSVLDTDHVVVDGHYGNNQYGTIGREAPPQPRPQLQPPPLFCGNCGSSGHSFQNCPRSMDRGSVSGTEISGNPSNVCFKCKQAGHWARDCPGPGSAMSSGFGGRNVMPSPSSSAGGAYGGRHYVGGF